MDYWDYPSALIPQTMEVRSLKSGWQNTSPITGWTESVELVAERFAWTITLGEKRHADAGAGQGFFGRIAGGVDRVRMWYFTRPQPLGTMRGTPTLVAAVTRGARSLQIATTGGLRAGDLFKIGDQVFMAAFDCTPVASVLTVNLVHRVRAALAAGAAVQWDRPTFLAIMPTASSSITLRPGAAAGMQVELLEAFS